MFHVKHVIYIRIMDEIEISSPPGVCDFPVSVRAAYACLIAKLAPAGLGQWLSQALPGASRSDGKSTGLPVGRRFLFQDCEDKR